MFRLVFADLIPMFRPLFSNNFSRCEFKHCQLEHVQFLSPKHIETTYGSMIELKCQLPPVRGEQYRIQIEKFYSDTNIKKTIFYWLKTKSFTEHSNFTDDKRLVVSWEQSTGLATIRINNLQIDDLGYVACRCIYCAQPVFDLAQVCRLFNSCLL